MRSLLQLVSAYLAICVALAGSVGVNPLLHRWVEHGGQGPAHVHLRAPAHAHPHAPAPFRNIDPAASAPRTVDAVPRGFGRVFVHPHAAFDLPTAPLAELWHALSHLLGERSSDSSTGSDPDSRSPSPSDRAPDPSDPGHRHDSLVQLLTDGLVEMNPETGLPGLAFNPVACVPGFPDLPPREVRWDALTAGRGPPPVGS